MLCLRLLLVYTSSTFHCRHAAGVLYFALSSSVFNIYLLLYIKLFMLLMYGVNSHIDHIFSIFKLFLFQIQNKCLQLNFRILTKYILNECRGDEILE